MVEWILGRTKKNGENEEGKLVGGCLVGRERKKRWWGPPESSPQNREKTRQKNGPVI